MPVDTMFTSVHGGAALRGRVLAALHQVGELSRGHRVDLDIMTFAFTDPAIADAITVVAGRHVDLTVRILAD